MSNSETPTYKDDAAKYGRLRNQKYTISKEEQAILVELLNSVPFTNVTFTKTDFTKTDDGYPILLGKAEAKLTAIQQENKNKKWYKFEFKEDTKQIEIALKFIKYHHYSTVVYQNPSFALTLAKGKASNLKLKHYEKQKPLQPKPSEPVSFRSKEVLAEMKKKSAGIFSTVLSFFSTDLILLFFSPNPIKKLADSFESKIKTHKANVNNIFIGKPNEKERYRREFERNPNIAFSLIPDQKKPWITHEDIYKYRNDLNPDAKQQVEAWFPQDSVFNEKAGKKGKKVLFADSPPLQASPAASTGSGHFHLFSQFESEPSLSLFPGLTFFSDPETKRNDFLTIATQKIKALEYLKSRTKNDDGGKKLKAVIEKDLHAVRALALKYSTAMELDTPVDFTDELNKLYPAPVPSNLNNGAPSIVLVPGDFSGNNPNTSFVNQSPTNSSDASPSASAPPSPPRQHHP